MNNQNTLVTQLRSYASAFKTVADALAGTTTTRTYKPRTRTMSAAGRLKISKAQKARWAKTRSKK